MRQIVILSGLLLFVLSPTHAQKLQPRLPQIRIHLEIGGHQSLHSSLNRFFTRELRALQDVLLVEKNPALQIKVDGMQTDTKKFIVSIIVLNANGFFLANDLGFGINNSDLQEIAQKITKQIDSMYLAPLRKTKNIAISNENSPRAFQSSPLVYPSTGTHWIVEKMEGGRFIKLEDNSLWEISPYDRSNSHLWLPYEEIFIIETDDDEFPYQLMNKNNEDTAAAKLIAL